jgi:hypothetical protein
MLLPVMQSYVNAGDFSFAPKVRRALRAHILYFLAMGALALAAIIYILSVKSFADW